VEPIKVTLCEECPEVEITDQGVTIGEDENIVRLSHAEWNELVRLIKDGKLQEVWKLKTSAPRHRLLALSERRSGGLRTSTPVI